MPDNPARQSRKVLENVWVLTDELSHEWGRNEVLRRGGVVGCEEMVEKWREVVGRGLRQKSLHAWLHRR